MSSLFTIGIYWKKPNTKKFIQQLLIDGILNEDVVTFELDDNITKRKVSKTFGKVSLGANWPNTEVGFVL